MTSIHNSLLKFRTVKVRSYRGFLGIKALKNIISELYYSLNYLEEEKLRAKNIPMLI